MQQAVGAQAEGAVTGAVGFIPSDDALSEGGKPGDMAVDGVDIPANRPYLRTFFLDFLYPGTVKEQYGSHAADDCHKDDIAENYFMLQ